MSRAHVRAGALVSVVLLAGCSAMRPVQKSYITTDQPKLVMVTRTDGSRVALVGARMVGDTVTGFTYDPQRPIGEYQEMPLSDIKVLEAQQYTWLRTGAVIGAGLVAWGGLTAFIIWEVEKEPVCTGVAC